MNHPHNFNFGFFGNVSNGFGTLPPNHALAFPNSYLPNNTLHSFPRHIREESESYSSDTPATPDNGTFKNCWNDGTNIPPSDNWFLTDFLPELSVEDKLSENKKGSKKMQKEKRSPKKRKLTKTVRDGKLGKTDILRQDILEIVFSGLGRPYEPGKIIRLQAKDSAEKMIRFNEVCPQHLVTYCIQKKYHWKKNHVQLCIDKCPYSPFTVQKFDCTQWYRVVPDDLAGMSTTLNQYISLFATKQTQGKVKEVVKYGDLRLNVSMIDHSINKECLHEQYKVKIMKSDYFTKIRTATPKSPTQPLNLTYVRFWVEIVKDNVYLCIVDTEALKGYDEKHSSKRPIKSAIGAYVDSGMEIELAIMSNFKDTNVVFCWGIRKEYVDKSFPKGVTFSLSLTGNKERPEWNWNMPITSNDTNQCSNRPDNQWLLGDCCHKNMPISQAFQLPTSVSNYSISNGMGVPREFANGSITPTPTPTPTTTASFPSLEPYSEINEGFVPNVERRPVKRSRQEMEEMILGIESNPMELILQEPPRESFLFDDFDGTFHFSRVGGRTSLNGHLESSLCFDPFYRKLAPKE